MIAPSHERRPLHDTVQELMKVDHGWWGAQMYEPYVPEITSWAIRYHQALRFYPDESVGYGYPEQYIRMFGEGYRPDAYIEADAAAGHVLKMPGPGAAE